MRRKGTWHGQKQKMNYPDAGLSLDPLEKNQGDSCDLIGKTRGGRAGQEENKPFVGKGGEKEKGSKKGKKIVGVENASRLKADIKSAQDSMQRRGKRRRAKEVVLGGREKKRGGGTVSNG